MDWLIRLLEGIIQSILTGLQLLMDNGNLGYFVPLVLLLVATWVAIVNRNRLCMAGYVLGWLVALAIMAVYLQAKGDTFLESITGRIPRNDFLTPGFWGLIIGFFLLVPFVRLRLQDALPIIVALLAAAAVIQLFLTYRAGASFDLQTTGLVELAYYRKRFVGIFALAFGTGVLLHVVLSAANPPRTPPAANPPQAPFQH